MRFDDRLCLLLLFAVFAAAVAAVNPIGNFPIDDDFAYGRTVLNFLEGNFRISSWISATVVFQTFTGVLFSLPFGFSFSALRFSSLAMALVGAVAAFLILRELKFSKQPALFGSMLLLFNPLYFTKAFNFHSDIHFMAMMLLSLLFYLLWLRKNSPALLLLGSLFSVFAMLIRQNGVLIPVAVAAYLLLSRRLSMRSFIVVAVLPFLAFAGYEAWFYLVHGATESSSLMAQYDLPHVADLILRLIPFRLFSMFMLAGLFLLPLTLPYLLRLQAFIAAMHAYDKALFASVIIAASAATLFMFFSFGRLLFYAPTMLHQRGLGPIYMQGLKSPVFPDALLAILAAAAILSGAVLAMLLKQQLARAASSCFGEPIHLVYLAGAFQLLFLLAALAFFDRYMLPLFFPGIVILLGSAKLRQVLPFGVVILVLMAAFSVAATQDYLSWHRARDSAIRDLQAQGIPADRIDGGFEHAAWNFYEFSREHPEVDNSKPYDPGWIRDYFRLIDSEYVISFTQLERYNAVKEYSYFSMLTLRNEPVYTLKRA